MYVYLYDHFLKEKRYDSVVKAIETRLTDYGIAGKIVRLQTFTNAEALVQEELRKGAITVVIIGNDATFARVVSRAASCDAPFGFIPVGSDNTIASVLGIPIGVEACDILARRRKVRLDVGWFNNRYFISKLHIAPHPLTVAYDERFRVSSQNASMELVVCNLQPFQWQNSSGQTRVIRPQDGKLEAFLRPLVKTSWLKKKQFEDPSIFPFEEMVVSSETPFEVEADGRTSKETKITIKLVKNRIEMIVGKERKF